MFKKLKARIEEGGDGGIENVSFGQRKLPGTAVRSLSAETPGEPLPVHANSVNIVSRSPAPSQESRDDEQDVGVAVAPSVQNDIPTNDQVSDVFPAHITIKPPSTYEAILEARIRELEDECLSLKEQLTQSNHDRDQQVSKLQTNIDKIDSERTELKLQVVELQLETSDLENRLEEGEKVWTGRLREMKAEKENGKKDFEERVTTLEEQMNEKEKELITQSDVCSELERKNSHLKGQLEAFKESTESEVIRRLQSEVADLEKGIRSRNVDLQIMERRIAHQAKGSQEEYGVVVDRQFSLESSYKELCSQLDQRKGENRQLVRDLEREQRQVSTKEKEIALLETQLKEQENKHRLLIEKLDHVRTNHERQILEVDALVQEKDERISELLCNLKQLRGGEDSIARLPDGSVLASVGGLRPPGMARRTATVGVQTSEEISVDDLHSDPAVLPVDESVGVAYSTVNNGESATMNSLGPGEELVMLREEQLRLEEDVAEKNKIIKVQQQKILDMKKALTKELQRSQSTQDLAGSFRGSAKIERSPSPPPPRITADVNFQYLKYVVLKFISSPEDESLQLVRAISTLLEFNPQEEKYVKDYLDYKMSWFGRLPTPLTPSTVKK